MNVRYRVTLTDAERKELRAFLAGGTQPARKLKRAQILLAADVGQSDEAIAASVQVGTSTIFRTVNGEARVPVAVRPGHAARVDYEYVRNGTANKRDGGTYVRGLPKFLASWFPHD